MGILMSRDDSRRWFTFMDQNESGFVDLLNWNELIAKSRRFSDLFQVLNPVVCDFFIVPKIRSRRFELGL